MNKYITLYLYHILLGYGMLSLLIYGMITNNDNLINIPIFWFWSTNILYLFALSKNFINTMIETMKQGKIYLPLQINILWCFISIGTFVYYEFLYLAIFSTISSVIMLTLKQQAFEKYKKENT